ncbi:MAG: DUF2061 domain-containing protein [Candidatus Glassbacteria bacterium]|nr:DUF2061 domain-containing protein [Candidatus Glassbacteria bacterium]
MSIESHHRSVAKALSWRILAIAITAGVAWIITGNIQFAATIGVVDSLVKLGIYYLHERVWNKLSFGRQEPPEHSI